MNSHIAPAASILRLCLCFCLVIFAGAHLSGCDVARNQLKFDREGNKELQDYRDALAPRLPEPEESAEEAAKGAIPELQSYMASPDSNMKPMPLVSISVNQTVSLRDMLFELARQADYDLELDPRITGSIIFSAKERPFDQVIDRISQVAGLRYKFDDDVLRVELDTPYNKAYKIDYLSYIRTSKGSVKNNNSVVSGDGANTGSDFEASGSSEANFWGELDANLKQILAGSDNSSLRTSRTPRVMAIDQNPIGGAFPPGATPEAAVPGQSAAVTGGTPPAPAVLRIESLPEEAEDNPQFNTASPATFSLNKQAGLINVYATDKAQKEIEKYLNLVRRGVTSQVLIEAKVLQVQLSDEYASGVDWGEIAPMLNQKLNVSLTGTSLPNFLNPPVPAGNLEVSITTGDVNAAIEAVSRFGTVKALASPRLTVLNNQVAVLNVATNHVYFDVDIDITDGTDDEQGRTTIDSESHSVPVGILVNVLPSINLDNNTISMAIRPTVTAIDANIEDPAVAFLAESQDLDFTSTIPQLSVQEIDSVIQVNSGQAIVMGGLLQDSTRVGNEGVPILSETPMLGSLFKRHADSIQKTELVIFLKATILRAPEDSVDTTDKDIYRAFSSDRHPLKF